MDVGVPVSDALPAKVCERRTRPLSSSTNPGVTSGQSLRLSFERPRLALPFPLASPSKSVLLRSYSVTVSCRSRSVRGRIEQTRLDHFPMFHQEVRGAILAHAAQRAAPGVVCEEPGAPGFIDFLASVSWHGAQAGIADDWSGSSRGHQRQAGTGTHSRRCAFARRLLMAPSFRCRRILQADDGDFPHSAPLSCRSLI